VTRQEHSQGDGSLSQKSVTKKAEGGPSPPCSSGWKGTRPQLMGKEAQKKITSQILKKKKNVILKARTLC